MATLHESAMKKINNGKMAHHAEILQSLADTADDSGAATASVTYGFIKDDEVIDDGDYVPEVTIRVRKFPFAD